MAFDLADRLYETSTTTGTGSYQLVGAVAGFRAFSSIGGSHCSYVVTMGTQFETGIGAVSGPTLSRTLILSSTNGGSVVNWGAGTKEVRCDVPAAVATSMYRGAARWAGTLGGTAAALTATLSPPIYSYWNGLSLVGSTPVALTNTAITLNVNGLGAVPVRQHDNATISTTAYGANNVLNFVYDGSVFRILQNNVTVTGGGGGEVPATRQIATTDSLQGGGDLSANRTLSLTGDTSAPAANHVYGTNSSGTRGWKPDPTGGGAQEHNRVQFTASGTYAKPAGLIAVFVRCQAPGGGSGGVAATGSGEGATSPGGGGGEYREGWLAASALGANTTVTIGGRGSAGAPGNNSGGDAGGASFGGHIQANGGQGSVGGPATNINPGNNGGPGGSGGSGGTLVIVGRQGGASKLIGGIAIPTNNGGGSHLSEGAAARVNDGGQPGANYGGGASGGLISSNSASQAGAQGGGGIVIVEEVL